jgi:hypothetical protein
MKSTKEEFYKAIEKADTFFAFTVTDGKATIASNNQEDVPKMLAYFLHKNQDVMQEVAAILDSKFKQEGKKQDDK